MLLNGDVTTLKAAAERARIHPDYLSRSFRKPHAMLFIDSEARARLAVGKLAASARLLDLLHAESEHVSFDAAKHTLGKTSHLLFQTRPLRVETGQHLCYI